MRVSAALLLVLVPAVASVAQESPLAPLARLAGHCWQGEFAEGGSWDRHCFAWAYDRRYLRDTHAVTGKRGPYGTKRAAKRVCCARPGVYTKQPQ